MHYELYFVLCILLRIYVIVSYFCSVILFSHGGGIAMRSKFIPAFKNADELNARAEAYFRSCEGRQAVDDAGEPLFDKNGAAVMAVPERPLTVTGLALALGFPSRCALFEYNGKAVYNDIIVRSLSRIEEYAEAKLFDKGQYSGAKFFLANNFKGWNDKPDDGSSDTLEKLDEVLCSLSKAMK